MNKDFDITKLLYKACSEADVWTEKKGEVYVGDTLAEIEFNVVHKNSAKRGKLVRIIEGTSYPFCIEGPDGVMQYFALAYPIPPNPEEIIEIVKDKEKNAICLAQKQSSEVIDEPHYRAFNGVNELLFRWLEINAHDRPTFTMPLIWVKYKDSNTRQLVTAFADNGVEMGAEFMTWEYFFEKMEFLNGTPCGVLIE